MLDREVRIANAVKPCFQHNVGAFEPSFPTVPRQSRFAVDAAIAQVFGLNPHMMSSTTRGRANAAFARQVAMYVMHVSCGLSLTDVGALYERDRTTVSHACALIEDLRDDPIFDRLLVLLEWVVRALMARAHLTVPPKPLFKF